MTNTTNYVLSWAPITSVISAKGRNPLGELVGN